MRFETSSHTVRYGCAVIAVALATGARLLLVPALGTQYLFAPFFLAILIAAWIGGFGPALVSLVIGALAALYLFLPPRGSFAIQGTEHQLGLAIYLLVGLGIALLGGRMQSGRRRALRRAATAATEREKLRVTLGSIGDAVAVTDAEGKVVSLNGVAQTLTGWLQEAAAGRPLEEVFVITNETTGLPVENPVARVLREGRVVGLANHTVLTARDGTRRPIDDSAAPIRAADGSIIGVVLVFRDVTEQRRAERELRQSEARKGAILETALDCIITCDRDGNVLEFNPAAERTFGYCREDVVGKDMADLIVPPALRERHRAGMAQVLAGGGGRMLGRRIEMLARRADGTEFPVELAITRIPGDGPAQFTAYLRDIGDRVRAEARRNARLATTQVLAQAAAVPEAAAGLVRAVCESLGWDAGFFWELPEGADTLRCLESFLRDGAPVAGFAEVSRRSSFRRGEGLPGQVWATGEPLWVLDVTRATNFPRVAAAAEAGLRAAFACPVAVGGETLGVIEFFSREARAPDADLLEMMSTVAGQFAQFAERRRAEERLRRNERELTDFFENATEGLHWVGPDGIILRANRAELDLLGYAPEEYIGRPIAEFHADEEVICDILRRLQAGEDLHNYEARLRCKDGSFRHVLINSNVLREGGQFRHTRCFTRDVTERRRNEAVLAGQKRVLEQLVHGAPLPDVLESLCEVIEGQSAGKLIATVLLMDEDGRRLRCAAGRRAPAAYARAVDGVKIGPRVGSCGTAAHRGEPVVVADIATDPLWADFRDLALDHGLRACWSTPIFCSQGRVLGTFAVYALVPRRPTAEELRLVDILARTAGVAVERRRAEDALREADRRKDEFLATLAHELRNPLAPMRNALQVMQLAGGDAEAVGQARAMMERQMRQMVRLVDDLLDVSRITRGRLELRKQRVELAAVVRTAVETSRPLIQSAGHELTVTLPPQPVHLDADPVRLAQVFANLLNNAAKYTERGGKIWLTAERQGSDAVVTVRDTGLGIPPEMIGKVFELFTQVDRTLEKAQGGLGIGLTLVRRLVEMHGGSVEARSDGYGRGSAFTVRLPVVLGLPHETEEPVAGREPATRRRVLVVDDNRDSAISLGMMLELMGNEIRTAHDGLEAVRAAEEFRPDVVLLDIGLPKLNGYEAARRMRAQPRGGEVVLIAVTGWGKDDDKRRSQEAGFNFHMVKPVEPAALEKLLAGLLTPG
jgi:PAS domain S-box-containing protein